MKFSVQEIVVSMTTETTITLTLSDEELLALRKILSAGYMAFKNGTDACDLADRLTASDVIGYIGFDFYYQELDEANLASKLNLGN